jgi:hypothetical protein
MDQSTSGGNQSATNPGGKYCRLVIYTAAGAGRFQKILGIFFIPRFQRFTP